MEKSILKKLESFEGFLTNIEVSNNQVSLRLSPWGYSKEDSPILLVNAQNFEVRNTDGLTLKAIQEHTYEISEIEYNEKKLLIWIDHYENPVEVKADKLKITSESYSHDEYKGFIKLFFDQINSHQNDGIKLRKKLNSIKTFVQQQTQRNQIKLENHDKGSLGFKILNEQKKLLNKVSNKMKE